MSWLTPGEVLDVEHHVRLGARQAHHIEWFERLNRGSRFFGRRGGHVDRFREIGRVQHQLDVASGAVEQDHGLGRPEAGRERDQRPRSRFGRAQDEATLRIGRFQRRTALHVDLDAGKRPSVRVRDQTPDLGFLRRFAGRGGGEHAGQQ